MSEDEIKQGYYFYIDNKNRNKGWKSMMKISNDGFETYKEEYERNYRLQKKIDELFKHKIRSEKINQIIDEIN